MDEKFFYSPEEFRKIIGCSSYLCYEGLRQGKIRHFKLGNRYFIPRSEIERLTECKAEGDEEPTPIPESK